MRIKLGRLHLFDLLAISSCTFIGAAGVSAWAAGMSVPRHLLSIAKSHATLLAAGGLHEGRYLAGLDLTLAPGVLTYWRFPGDAGVPTQFSFEGSTNVVAAKAQFPAPVRIVEGGTTSFGYRNEVLFPITATPQDARRPARLDVTVHYATCDTICVPAETHQTIDLYPDAASGPELERIEAWSARAPRPLPSALAPKIERVHDAALARWRVFFPGISSAKTDLFVEGPQDWYFDSKPEGGALFSVSLAQKPDGDAGGAIPVTLTLVAGDQAYETRASLDATKQ